MYLKVGISAAICVSLVLSLIFFFYLFALFYYYFLDAYCFFKRHKGN